MAPASFGETPRESQDADSRGSNANFRGYPSSLGIEGIGVHVLSSHPRKSAHHSRTSASQVFRDSECMDRHERPAYRSALPTEPLATASLMALDSTRALYGKGPRRAKDYESRHWNSGEWEVRSGCAPPLGRGLNGSLAFSGGISQLSRTALRAPPVRGKGPSPT